MKHTPTTDTPFDTQFCFTDPAEVYYQPIHLLSSAKGGYVHADHSPVSPMEFAHLCEHFPGDLMVDGQAHCNVSHSY